MKTKKAKKRQTKNKRKPYCMQCLMNALQSMGTETCEKTGDDKGLKQTKITTYFKFNIEWEKMGVADTRNKKVKKDI